MAPTRPAAKSTSKPGPKPGPKPAQLRQKPLEFYTTSSTGHQTSNAVTKPAAWYRHRQSKLKSQFGSGSLPLSVAKPSGGNSRSDEIPPPTAAATATEEGKPIFSSCNIHISGSTAPHISDHKLKHLLTFHGATVHVMLRRSSTTHVLLCPSATVGSGAGGGLAAKKLQKEIEAKKGARMKFVTVQWALDSIAAGRRLLEGKYMEHGVGRDAGQSTLSPFLVKGNAK